ncbi:hypothetical protein AVEN_143260-1 [Araneus ventricosus]|uniref:Uncharacterized protein n=1 Tax=Araneus ventricosus TaxID=182803 RepID=A0A4Y2AFA8_ARAVE|nr:hypothetical protein AVEN_143260-1 [Araneus ventricosus]
MYGSIPAAVGLCNPNAVLRTEPSRISNLPLHATSILTGFHIDDRFWYGAVGFACRGVIGNYGLKDQVSSVQDLFPIHQQPVEAQGALILSGLLCRDLSCHSHDFDLGRVYTNACLM